MIAQEQHLAESLARREAVFHDAWASNTQLDDILVRECFEAPTALENRFILSRMGSLRGKKLLDIGAGLGESSVYFALQGAKVTTIDVSPVMVQTALRLGRKFNVELEGIAAEGENINVPSESYDLVYIANTIHHVQDRALLFEQMRRALKPGGMFFSYDPLTYNPAINIYRRMATEVRTPDEAPLSIADIRLAQKYFSNVGHREFWISSLALFAKYYLADGVHPNADRYWKRILREPQSNLRWWIPLAKLDSVLSRIPLVRWMAWNMVMWGQKADTQPRASPKQLKPHSQVSTKGYAFLARYSGLEMCSPIELRNPVTTSTLRFDTGKMWCGSQAAYAYGAVEGMVCRNICLH